MITVFGFLFSIFPIISLPLTLFAMFFTKNTNIKRIYVFMFAVSISLILFHCIPNNTTDLSRYYKMIDSYSFIPLTEIFETFFSKPEPISYLLFYIISMLGNHSYLMLITTLVSYIILLYIIFDYQKEKKLSNTKFNIVLIYFLCTFLIIYHITGVRFCLARLTFFLALYLDMYKGNKKIYVKILYLIPVLIHISSITLLLIRLLLFINKNKFNIKSFIIILLVSLSPRILYVLTDVLSNFGLFSYISQRLNDYSSVKNEFANIFLLQVALMIFMFLLILWIKLKKVPTNTKMLNFSIMTLIISLLFINVSTISTRFISVVCSFSVLLLMDILSTIKVKDFIWLSVLTLLFSAFYFAFQIIQLTKFGEYVNLFGISLFDNFFALICLTLYSIFTLKNKRREEKM